MPKQSILNTEYFASAFLCNRSLLLVSIDRFIRLCYTTYNEYRYNNNRYNDMRNKGVNRWRGRNFKR